MNINEIKEKVNSSEYDFLRNNELLGNNICLLTLGGSHSYGTNISSSQHVSDCDIRGIYLHSPKEILTMTYRDKPFEHRETDTVIYPLKQIINLLINANPNVMEIFCTKDEHLLICTENGKLLRDNFNLFLSQKVIASYGGYSIQQLRKLENSLARDSYPQAIKEEHIKNSIKKQMLTMTDRYKDFTDKELNLYIDKSNKGEYDSEIFMDLNFNHYPLRDFKNIYTEMSQVVRDYDKLNHRNNKKDEEHLLKHAMHLIRLCICCKSLLEGKGLNTYMGEHIPLLLDIRNGKYSYDEIFEMYRKYEKEIEYVKANTTLPKEPNYNKINELVMEINGKIIKNNAYLNI